MKSSRPYPRLDGRKIGNALVVASMLMSLCILSLIKARYCSAPYLRSQSSDVIETMAIQSVKHAIRGTVIDPNRPLCANTSKRSYVCEAEGDIRIKASSRTVFLPPSLTKEQWTSKPYARNHDAYAMKNTEQWTLKPFDEHPPACTKTHSVPALVFSIGGFTGNLYHDFTDVIVPLFISSYQFRGEVQFILADVKAWWVTKFGPILKQLTNYELIDAGEDGEKVRCFPRLILGLDYHKEIGVDPAKTLGNYSMAQFKEVLRKAFSLKRATVEATGVKSSKKRKPRLLIITRKKTRVFMNERGLEDMALSLGFDVKVAEPDSTSDLGKFARLVNSVDVMIGVHGAGLTNMVFLPDNAVLIQIVPMGELDWLVKETFQDPAPDLKIRYFDYQIQLDESTLSEQYPPGHPVLTDPMSIQNKGWYEISRIYLENQDVKPHLGRLRNKLLEVLRSMPQFSLKNSTSAAH